MSKETLIEKLRGYKSTPRHCEELCYEAANEIESLRQQLADSQKQVTLLRSALTVAYSALCEVFGEYPLNRGLSDAVFAVGNALSATEPKP